MTVAGRTCTQLADDVFTLSHYISRHIHDELWSVLISLVVPLNWLDDQCHLREPQRQVVSDADFPAEQTWARLPPLADQALPLTSPVRCLYELGAAIGDYQLALLPMQPLSYGTGDFDSWPSPESLMRAIRKIPADMVAAIPLLDSLVRASTRVTANRGETMRGLIAAISEHMYIKPAQADIDRHFHPEDELDLLFRIYKSLNSGFSGVDYDRLSNTYDSIQRGLEWLRWDRLPAQEQERRIREATRGNQVAGVLYVHGEAVRIVYRKKRKQERQENPIMIILDYFQRDAAPEEGWPASIDNPFWPDSGSGRPSSIEKKTTNAVESLNNSLTRIKFSTSNHGDLIYWVRT